MFSYGPSSYHILLHPDLPLRPPTMSSYPTSYPSSYHVLLYPVLPPYPTTMSSFTLSSYHDLPPFLIPVLLPCPPMDRPPTMSSYTMPSYPIILPWPPIPCLIPSSHSVLPLSHPSPSLPIVPLEANLQIRSSPGCLRIHLLLHLFATDVSNDSILWRTYANYDPGTILASDLNCLQAENYSHF
jgi:hypothetical protein